jgi:hypothetical protein
LTDSPIGSRNALVAYQKDVLVRIPVSATNLSAVPPPLSKTKVSVDAVSDLIDLARQLGILYEKGDPI